MRTQVICQKRCQKGEKGGKWGEKGGKIGAKKGVVIFKKSVIDTFFNASDTFVYKKSYKKRGGVLEIF